MTDQEPVVWHEPGAYGNVTTHKDWALANGWEPLYAAPVHASDMSQECVDETAKCGHDPVAWREVAGKTTHYYDYNEDGRGEPLYAAPQPDLARVGEVGVWGDKREWVGLTDGEYTTLFRAAENLLGFCHAVESKLKEKNT
jgi:hypothetical protein